MPTQPAILGTARLNNVRLNYLTAAQAADRATHIRVIIGGIDVTHPDAPMRVIYKSMSIRDALFDTPNTCAMTLYGASAPHVGQSVEVWINSNAPQLLFNGEIQTVDRTYKGQPTTVLHPVTAIDDTARANRRRPLMRFANVSATIIAQTLMSAYVPGFSPAGIEANLPAVTITFDGSEAGMKGCLTALAKLVGAYWYFENKTLYFFVTPPGTPPDPIDDTPGRFLHEPAITWAIDKSQVRTRVYGKGAATQIAASIAAATDVVPLVNGEMFSATGGQAIAAVTPDAAASQVVTYTGVQLGGGGGLVGPGASPSAAPGVALVNGAGVETGVHRYAVTFRTAAGESLPGPVAEIAVGLVAPPTVAPVPGAPTTGGSVDAGTHFYAVTFVTAVGETTTPGVTQYVTTTQGAGVAAPGASSAALRQVVGNLDGLTIYRYQVTFTVTGGETLPGPATNAIQSSAPVSPSSISQSYALETGHLVPDQVYSYALAFIVGSSYETALGPTLVVDLPPDPLLTQVVFQNLTASPDARVTGRKLYRWVPNVWRLVATIPDNNPNTWYRDGVADAGLGPIRSGTGVIGTVPGNQATVTLPTSVDARVIGRKVYRSDSGAPYRYLTTVSNNVATQVTDNTAFVTGQPDAPTTDTSGGVSYKTVPLTGIEKGPANVTARRIYRSDGGDYRLVDTIANNTQTTYTDTKAAASLGAVLPSVNTAAANQVLVTLPVGGTGVIDRYLYRTAAGQSALKLLTGFGNNTATQHLDLASDASLAAAPPTVDTSGLVQPTGQVSAGSTSLVVANPAPFAAGGGWAIVGNGEQAVRYTGKSATALTGIPASGPGAIVASISYNSTVTAAPSLLGVTGLVDAVIRNAPIHVWVQRDDLAAQAYMAGLDGGGDGVYEHIWSDERRTEGSLRQVCDAQLALYSRPLVTVTYASRDLKTKSGKTVTIALTTPAIQESLTIQDVGISELGIKGLAPKFTVTASTARQSFEAILQMLIRKADA